MTITTAPTQLDQENPWPGLESFKENSHEFFYGRDQEAQSLLSHVLDAPVTVLYGRSGLGKTSLLQAGLFPELRDRDFLPIYVRFALKPGAAPLFRQLHRTVRDSIRADVPDAVLPSDDESLWEYLHGADFELWSAQNYPLTPVIVLDQFEELFTLGERVSNRVSTFRNELGDLAENRIPAELAARIDDDVAVAERFNLRSRNYKLLISLREDFLPHLEEWCRLIPALGRSRVRLLPLQAEQALDAVRKPGSHLMTEELARRVVDIIDGEDLHLGTHTALPDVARADDDTGATVVEPALLSLFCRELNEERKRRGRTHFDEDLVEDARRDILSNYYSACVGDLPPRVAEFIESELITEKGFRDSYVREDAVPARLTEAELAQLISARLLRLEDRYGAQRIELTHDVLNGVVREHRDRRRAEVERLALAAHGERERQALERAAAEREAELDRERERRLESEQTTRRFRTLSAVLAIVCAAAVVLAVVAVTARKTASDRFLDATAQRLYGESQLMLAGLQPDGSDDVLGMQELLAALNIPSRSRGQMYPLLGALNQERDLLKVIDIPAMVMSVAFSPDGTRIASANADNTVRLWDAATGQPIGQPLRGHDSTVMSVAFSPDGTRIASGSNDETVRLWDAATGQPIGQPLRHDSPVMSVAFSPDGTRIASANADHTVRLWDAATGQPIGQPLRGHDSVVMRVAFSPDGRRIASGSFDETVRLWDAATGQQIGQPLRHDGVVFGVAFSPDGTRIATSGGDNTVRLWDVATGQPIGQPIQDAYVMAVVFSPDGRRIAAGGGDNTIRLFDAATGQPIGTLKGHRSAVEAVAFSPDGGRLVSGGDDQTVRVWDARSWQPLLGHDDLAVAIFSDHGHRVVSGSADGTVRRWDAATGYPIGEPLRVDDDTVEALYPMGEERLVSTGKVDEIEIVRLWDRDTGKPIGEPLRLPRRVIGTFSWNQTGRIAAQTEVGALQVFDADTMRPVGEQIRPESPVVTFTISDDGHTLATGSLDQSVRVWDVDTGKPLGPQMTGNGNFPRLAFSPDGNLLAAAGTGGINNADNTLRLWDTRTFQPVGDPIHVDSAVITAAFSPDGRIVASGSGDGTIRLWDVGDHTPLGAPLTGHTGVVLSLEFSPDGTKLLSASEDHTLRFWPVPNRSPDASRDALCAKLTQNMSHKEWNEVVSSEIPYIQVCPDLPVADDAG